jgi:hypothetical protein
MDRAKCSGTRRVKPAGREQSGAYPDGQRTRAMNSLHHPVGMLLASNQEQLVALRDRLDDFRARLELFNTNLNLLKTLLRDAESKIREYRAQLSR